MNIEYNVTMIKVKDLKFASFNPPDRVSPRNTKGLRDMIVQAGGILVPIMITPELVIIDGHRRVAIAAELGIDEVPALILEGKLAVELYMLTNGGTRKITPAEYMQAYNLGYPLDNVPHITRAHIRRLKEVCDDELFKSLCDKGRSPGVIGNASRVANYCSDTSGEFYRKVIVWYETHHQQFPSRRFMDANQPAMILKEAVMKNKPLLMSWST